MKTLVVYESMFGNTRRIAESIRDGASTHGAAEAVNVNHVTTGHLGLVDLLIVGGPTHVHGMSRQPTRDGALLQVTPDLPLEADAPGTGVREWLELLHCTTRLGAAFDTRVDMAAWITGSASEGIGRAMKHHGISLVIHPESFFVTDETELESGEESRARAWGEQVSQAALSAIDAHPVARA
jgi:hypothetical protein